VLLLLGDEGAQGGEVVVAHTGGDGRAEEVLAGPRLAELEGGERASQRPPTTPEVAQVRHLDAQDAGVPAPPNVEPVTPARVRVVDGAGGLDRGIAVHDEQWVHRVSMHHAATRAASGPPIATPRQNGLVHEQERPLCWTEQVRIGARTRGRSGGDGCDGCLEARGDG
jgi:hypothetical protein